MKAGWQVVGRIVLLTLLVPQVFVSAYFFPLLMTGPQRWEFLKTIAGLGLSISWVSTPFFVCVAGLYQVLIKFRVPYAGIFLSVLAAGFGGVALWNNLIFDLFGYLRSALPLLICCAVSVGYALAERLYKAGLPPAPSDASSTRNAPE
ncbi:MAG TPA: hypothetical protein P5026_05365 [Kiritimatiellia bacterium]|nr:hypothetical protein [Kiritimatiellia bacterium]HRU70582.1 hypothetical protein [Kiritimatiellia bacterium]